MPEPLQFHLVQALIFFGAGLAICAGALGVAGLIRPNRPSADKMTSYECGEPPIGPGQFRLNIRFYTMALIFIIFDVELVAILPTAVLFRDWLEKGLGKFAFAEIFIFVAILAVGLVYIWRKGDIEWIKDIPEARREPS